MALFRNCVWSILLTLKSESKTEVFRLGRHVRSTLDIVARVFSGWRTKILRAADALYARQREGPYRFIQNRSRTSAVALKSDAAAEKSKDQLINFREIFLVARFSTFATISALFGPAVPR